MAEILNGKKYKTPNGNVLEESELRETYGDRFDSFLSEGLITEVTDEDESDQAQSEIEYTTPNGTVLTETELKTQYGDRFEDFLSQGLLKKKEDTESGSDSPEEVTESITEEETTDISSDSSDAPVEQEDTELVEVIEYNDQGIGAPREVTKKEKLEILTDRFYNPQVIKRPTEQGEQTQVEAQILSDEDKQFLADQGGFQLKMESIPAPGMPGGVQTQVTLVDADGRRQNTDLNKEVDLHTIKDTHVTTIKDQKGNVLAERTGDLTTNEAKRIQENKVRDYANLYLDDGRDAKTIQADKDKAELYKQKRKLQYDLKDMDTEMNSLLSFKSGDKTYTLTEKELRGEDKKKYDYLKAQRGKTAKELEGVTFRWSITANPYYDETTENRVYNPYTGEYTEKINAPQAVITHDENVNAKAEKMAKTTAEDDLLQLQADAYYDVLGLAKLVKQNVKDIADERTTLGGFMQNLDEEVAGFPGSKDASLNNKLPLILSDHPLAVQFNEKLQQLDVLSRAVELNRDPRTEASDQPLIDLSYMEKGFTSMFLGQEAAKQTSLSLDPAAEKGKVKMTAEQPFVAALEEAGFTGQGLEKMKEDAKATFGEGTLELGGNITGMVLQLQSGAGLINATKLPAYLRLGRALTTKKYGKWAASGYNVVSSGVSEGIKWGVTGKMYGMEEQYDPVLGMTFGVVSPLFQMGTQVLKKIPGVEALDDFITYKIPLGSTAKVVGGKAGEATTGVSIAYAAEMVDGLVKGKNTSEVWNEVIYGITDHDPEGVDPLEKAAKLWTVMFAAGIAHQGTKKKFFEALGKDILAAQGRVPVGKGGLKLNWDWVKSQAPKPPEGEAYTDVMLIDAGIKEIVENGTPTDKANLKTMQDAVIYNKNLEGVKEQIEEYQSQQEKAENQTDAIKKITTEVKKGEGADPADVTLNTENINAITNATKPERTNISNTVRNQVKNNNITAAEGQEIINKVNEVLTVASEIGTDNTTIRSQVGEKMNELKEIEAELQGYDKLKWKGTEVQTKVTSLKERAAELESELNTLANTPETTSMLLNDLATNKIRQEKVLRDPVWLENNKELKEEILLTKAEKDLTTPAALKEVAKKYEAKEKADKEVVETVEEKVDLTEVVQEAPQATGTEKPGGIKVKNVVEEGGVEVFTLSDGSTVKISKKGEHVDGDDKINYIDRSVTVTDKDGNITTETTHTSAQDPRYEEVNTTEIVNNIIKNKQDAIQEPSAAEVPAQEPPKDSPAVGEGVPEIKEATQEVKEEVEVKPEAKEEVEIATETYTKTFKDRTHPVRGPKNQKETFSEGIDEYNSLVSMHEAYPEKVIKPIELITDKTGNATGYVMEVVDGVELGEWLKDNEMSQSMYDDIASTVKGLHGKGLYHGDLKANNIMVDKAGNWKIIDPVGFQHADNLSPEMLKEAERLDLKSLDNLAKNVTAETKPTELSTKEYEERFKAERAVKSHIRKGFTDDTFEVNRYEKGSLIRPTDIADVKVGDVVMDKQGKAVLVTEIVENPDAPGSKQLWVSRHINPTAPHNGGTDKLSITDRIYKTTLKSTEIFSKKEPLKEATAPVTKGYKPRKKPTGDRKTTEKLIKSLEKDLATEQESEFKSEELITDYKKEIEKAKEKLQTLTEEPKVEKTTAAKPGVPQPRKKPTATKPSEKAISAAEYYDQQSKKEGSKTGEIIEKMMELYPPSVVRKVLNTVGISSTTTIGRQFELKQLAKDLLAESKAAEGALTLNKKTVKEIADKITAIKKIVTKFAPDFTIRSGVVNTILKKPAKVKLTPDQAQEIVDEVGRLVAKVGKPPIIKYIDKTLKSVIKPKTTKGGHPKVTMSAPAQRALMVVNEMLSGIDLRNLSFESLEKIADNIAEIAKDGSLTKARADKIKRIAKASFEGQVATGLYRNVKPTELNTFAEIEEFLKEGKRFVIIDGNMVTKTGDTGLKNFLEDNPFSSLEGAKGYETITMERGRRAKDPVGLKKAAAGTLNLINPTKHMANIVTQLKRIGRKSPELRPITEDLISEITEEIPYKIEKGRRELKELSDKTLIESFGSIKAGNKALDKPVTGMFLVNDKAIATGVVADLATVQKVYSQDAAYLRQKAKETEKPAEKKSLEAQADSFENILKNSDINRKAIEEHVKKTPGLQKYVDANLKFYTEASPRFDPLAVEVTGRPFTRLNYYPMWRSIDAVEGAQRQANLEQLEDPSVPFLNRSAMTDRLKMRTENAKKVRTDVDSRFKMLDYIENMLHAENYIPLSNKINQLTNPQVRGKLYEKIGKTDYTNFQANLDAIIDPKYSVPTDAALDWVSRFNRFGITLQLGGSIKNIGKQLTSIQHWGYAGLKDGITTLDIVEASLEIPFNKEYQEVALNILKSDFVRDRIRKSDIDPDLKTDALDAINSGGAKLWKWYQTIALSPIIIGDIGGVLGGVPFAVAKYKKVKTTPKGEYDNKAYIKAYKRFAAEASLAQQSAKVFTMSAFQRTKGGRLATTYRTAQAQALNKSMQGWIDMTDPTLSADQRRKGFFQWQYFTRASFGFNYFSTGAASIALLGLAGGAHSISKEEEEQAIFESIVGALESYIQGFGAQAYLPLVLMNVAQGKPWEFNLPPVASKATEVLKAIQPLGKMLTTSYDELSDSEKRKLDLLWKHYKTIYKRFKEEGGEGIINELINKKDVSFLNPLFETIVKGKDFDVTRTGVKTSKSDEEEVDQGEGVLELLIDPATIPAREGYTRQSISRQDQPTRQSK